VCAPKILTLRECPVCGARLQREFDEDGDHDEPEPEEEE
jgi:sarcosine oxidase delta subunit